MIKLIGSVQGIKKHKKEYKMSALRTLLLICVSVFVGNIVLMLLDNAPMNIWIARVIGGIARATTGILLINYYQKRKLNENYKITQPPTHGTWWLFLFLYCFSIIY
ncbi:hypothetical protein MXM15_01635 [Staphylococcus xylosus]|uniref:hypothetical protein n=1 Tax=Staphylococcus xylosus TaxID=1288 RepID=UPI002DBF3115|nr:hypothetical protein [Staphylococcus xylosus]MEB6244361.1 hypothetical protein [Staphylococcus xylosus]